MASKKPTMAQAYKAAAKPKDKGIVGEGKDVLKAAGNSVKQQAEFVGAVGKGAAKGAGAVAKGAGKVAGKVANITIGDIASAPLDIAKNAAKGAAKVGSMLGGSKKSVGSMAGKKALDPMTYVGKAAGKAAAKKAYPGKAGGTLADANKAATYAIQSREFSKSPSGGTRSESAVNRVFANLERDRARAVGSKAASKANKARQATDSKYDKVSGTPKPKRSRMDPGMYKPKGTPRPKQKDPGMYKPRGKNPGQSGGRPSQRGM